MTDAWDPSIPEHKAIAHGIEIGDGIPEMRTRKDARKALVSVGFQIEHEEDLADRPDPIPWYYPLEGDFSKAQTWGDYFTVFRTTRFGMWTTSTGVWVLEKVGLVPEGTWAVGETMKVAAKALVDGGRTKVSSCLSSPFSLLLTCASVRFRSSSLRCCSMSAASPPLLRSIDYGTIFLPDNDVAVILFTCFSVLMK